MMNALFDLNGKDCAHYGLESGHWIWHRQRFGPGRGDDYFKWEECREAESSRLHSLPAKDSRFMATHFDVSDSNQVDQKISTIEREVGPIDILVNNAGIQRRGPLETIEESVWREVIETNLTAVFLTTKRVVKGMIDRRSGKIINICSLMSEISRPTIAPYTASKGGVKMLTKGHGCGVGKV